jgi:hypothetical protein
MAASAPVVVTHCTTRILPIIICTAAAKRGSAIECSDERCTIRILFPSTHPPMTEPKIASTTTANIELQNIEREARKEKKNFIVSSDYYGQLSAHKYVNVVVGVQ